MFRECGIFWFPFYYLYRFSFSCFLFCWFLYHSLKTRLKKIIHYVFYTFRNDFSVVSSFMTYHRVCNYSNTTCVTNGAGTANTSGEPEFTPGFYWGSCYSNFSYMCIFADRCLSFCTFSFGHCVVCSSTKYGFWLPPWNIQIHALRRHWLSFLLISKINMFLSFYFLYFLYWWPQS